MGRQRRRVGQWVGVLVALWAATSCGEAVRWEGAPVVRGSFFHGVHGLAFDADDRLFLGDVFGQTLYEMRPEAGAVSPSVPAPLGESDDLEFGPDGTLVWTSFFAGEVRARRPDGQIVTLASGHPGFNSLAFAPDGRLFATTVFLGDALYEIDLAGEAPARLVMEGMGGLNGFDFGPDGKLYGPLFYKGKIARVDVDAATLEVVAEGFAVPAAVNFNSQGQLYAVDAARGQVVHVDPHTGATRVVAQLRSGLDNLAFDSTDRLFVTNFADNAVIEVDLETGEPRTFVAGQLCLPGAIVFDRDRGTLFVPDLFAFRAVTPPSYEVLEIARDFEDELHFPYFVAVGRKWLALSGMRIGDLSPGAVQILNADTGAHHALLEDFEMPHGLVFISDYKIVVAEHARGELVLVDIREPAERRVIASGLEGPVSLALGPPRTIYASELAGVISQIDVDSGERRVVAEGLDAPEGIDVFPSGHLAVAEVGARRVVSIDPENGRITILADDLPIGLDLPDALPPVGIPTGVAALDDEVIYLSSDTHTAIYRLSKPLP